MDDRKGHSVLVMARLEGVCRGDTISLLLPSVVLFICPRILPDPFAGASHVEHMYSLSEEQMSFWHIDLFTVADLLIVNIV